MQQDYMRRLNDQFDGWGERNKSCAVFVHSYATS
ncbi:hypothetical protein [Salmonella enterica]